MMPPALLQMFISDLLLDQYNHQQIASQNSNNVIMWVGIKNTMKETVEQSD